MNKEKLLKEEEFAKKIVSLASEEHLTVQEFLEATEIAKGISENSSIEIDSISRTDFPSLHICDDSKEGLFN